MTDQEFGDRCYVVVAATVTTAVMLALVAFVFALALQAVGIL